MRRSKKSSLSDLVEVTSNIELEEEKTVTYEDHEYTYTVLKYTMFKSFYSVTVKGGPYKYSATTSCKGVLIKPSIKKFMRIIKHK